MHNETPLRKKIFWGIINTALAFPARHAGAAEPTFANPLASDSITALIGSVADIVFKIGIPVAALFIIYSGMMFVTARGSEDQLKKAKMTFMWTMIGTAVLLGAKVIAVAIKETVSAL